MSDNLNDMVQAGLKVRGDESMADDYRQAMLSAGIDPDDMPTAPDPGPAVEPISLESLVDVPSKREGVKKESLPMRYLGFKTQNGGGRYPGYRSFMLIDVWHPTLGRQLVTHSYQREDDTYTPLAEWVRDRMKRGDVFQVGEVATKRGRTVYQPITVG